MDQGVGLTVVGRHRPVLLDGNIGRHGEPIGAAAVKGAAFLVANADQIELAGSKPLKADIRVRKYVTPR
jgi:hypothetical protein